MSDSLHPIALHGVPRSGTTWLGEILNSHPHVRYAYQPLFSYAFKDYLAPNAERQRINDFFSEIAQSDDDFVRQSEARSTGRLPNFAKDVPTHTAYKEVRYHHILPNLIEQMPNLRTILIVRDPRAVISSWLRAPREFRSDLGWQVEDEWRSAASKNQDRAEEFNGYEKWKEATNMYVDLSQKYADRVLLVRYCDLLANPHDKTSEIMRFCGLEVTPQTRTFLQVEASDTPSDPYGVDARRSSDEGWRRHLPTAIADEIRADLADTPLAQFLTP